jgi:uncharacterized protein
MVSSHGKFIWYELITTDVEAAKAFYTRVMSWGARNAAVPGMAYTLFTVGGASVSGLMNLPEHVRQMGARPTWVGYVEVDDVDVAADHITRLGGQLYVPPTTIPNISRFAVFADPQKAALALFKPLAPGQERTSELGAPGRVGWHELLANDREKALAFYRELFGWQEAGVNVGKFGDKAAYQLFSAGRQTIGGVLNKPPAVEAPFWLYYFNIGDIDAAVRRVQTGGGRVFVGPLQMSESNWIVQCADPQGAVFALEGTRKNETIGYFERNTPSTPADARGRRWSW